MKEDFLKQVDELKAKKDLKIKLKLLYEYYQNNSEKDEIAINILIEKILTALFSNYKDDKSVPFSFFDTPIGQVIVILKTKKEKVLYVSDVMEVLGLSRQAVIKKIKKKVLKAEKPGRDWIIKEKDFKEYLASDSSHKNKIIYPSEEESIISPYEDTEENIYIKERGFYCYEVTGERGLYQ